MVVPNSEYAERRRRFMESMGQGVAVFASTPVAIRNNDVEHEYRQDSDLFYLTGFDEPESVLILSTEHAEHRMVLFVRPRDPERETWDGPRAGIEGAKARFGADEAFPMAELSKKLPEYLKDVKRLHYRLGVDRAFDNVLLNAIDDVRRRARMGITPPREIVDPSVILHEMRLRKSGAEIEVMLKAAAITREAHARAMVVARPGRYEYEVEAEIMRVFRMHGAERPAYGSIVGSGVNATVLHHRRNDRQMKDNELLLIDAGAEFGYYACDVTRTFPVSGKFTAEQRAAYQLVLDSQLAAIEAVKPGATLPGIHAVALRVLVRGLIKLGIIEGPEDTAIEKELFKPYYMHRTSHWLGMDVHDVGDYHVPIPAGQPLPADPKAPRTQPRPIEPGFVLTIEPGLYFAPTTPCDPKWHGIGIRIEDDVLVTPEGHRVLTEGIPKGVDELERVLGSRPAA
ncbi:MAG TPA: aminopeptidase P N-terminal domain-containing protein [Polyangiales bacterium]|jgi:Xaa-Pro aminopeptidase|nr:aminopeptidase P N-terminal domain-containing protein [Polyangiales bacterium]